MRSPAGVPVRTARGSKTPGSPAVSTNTVGRPSTDWTAPAGTARIAAAPATLKQVSTNIPDLSGNPTPPTSMRTGTVRVAGSTTGGMKVTVPRTAVPERRGADLRRQAGAEVLDLGLRHVGQHPECGCPRAGRRPPFRAHDLAQRGVALHLAGDGGADGVARFDLAGADQALEIGRRHAPQAQLVGGGALGGFRRPQVGLGLAAVAVAALVLAHRHALLRQEVLGPLGGAAGDFQRGAGHLDLGAPLEEIALGLAQRHAVHHQEHVAPGHAVASRACTSATRPDTGVLTWAIRSVSKVTRPG